MYKLLLILFSVLCLSFLECLFPSGCICVSHSFLKMNTHTCTCVELIYFAQTHNIRYIFIAQMCFLHCIGRRPNLSLSLFSSLSFPFSFILSLCPFSLSICLSIIRPQLVSPSLLSPPPSFDHSTLSLTISTAITSSHLISLHHTPLHLTSLHHTPLHLTPLHHTPLHPTSLLHFT